MTKHLPIRPMTRSQMPSTNNFEFFELVSLFLIGYNAITNTKALKVNTEIAHELKILNRKEQKNDKNLSIATSNCVRD